mgnify:CR=1 FL=1
MLWSWIVRLVLIVRFGRLLRRRLLVVWLILVWIGRLLRLWCWFGRFVRLIILVVLSGFDSKSLGAAVAGDSFVFAIDRYSDESLGGVIARFETVELSSGSVVDLFAVGVVDAVDSAFVSSAVVSGVFDREFVAIAGDMVDT